MYLWRFGASFAACKDFHRQTILFCGMVPKVVCFVVLAACVQGAPDDQDMDRTSSWNNVLPLASRSPTYIPVSMGEPISCICGGQFHVGERVITTSTWLAQPPAGTLGTAYAGSSAHIFVVFDGYDDDEHGNDWVRCTDTRQCGSCPSGQADTGGVWAECASIATAPTLAPTPAPTTTTAAPTALPTTVATTTGPTQCDVAREQVHVAEMEVAVYCGTTAASSAPPATTHTMNVLVTALVTAIISASSAFMVTRAIMLRQRDALREPFVAM